VTAASIWNTTNTDCYQYFCILEKWNLRPYLTITATTDQNVNRLQAWNGQNRC